MKVYLVFLYNYYDEDGVDETIKHKLFTTKEQAIEYFNQLKQKNLEGLDKTDFVIEETEDGAVVYRDGYYSSNRIIIEIKHLEVL